MPWAGHAVLSEPLTLAGSRDLVPVSATLAANEVIASRRRAGQPVLPLAFGESGLPVHPRLRAELAGASADGGYGPVAGITPLREAAAGYWTRRGLPTSPDLVAAGPGSKALLFGLLLALGTEIAVPQPSWVSYAAQARLSGLSVHYIPAARGAGGICDPQALDDTVTAAAATGRRIGSVLVTLPDNPTGQVASPDAVRQLCEVAGRHHLIIISDEIYRDLVHDPHMPFLSPACVAPSRTVVTTALSKSLSVGGWRIGVTRLPDSKTGRTLWERLMGVASEIWSAAPVPVQHAAAVAFTEPAELAERVRASRSLHAVVARAAHAACADAGLTIAVPQAGFYLYPDFAPLQEQLAHRFGVRSAAGLAAILLDRYGAATLPGSAFGDDAGALRLRLATGMLYGEDDERREAALDASDPLQLPWIRASLDRLADVLADLAGR
jgi:aspartate aminotransferase